MRLFDAKGRHRAIWHIGIVVALSGMAIMIVGYSISPYLVERDREIFETLSFDDPNWLYYRDIGDAAMVFGGSYLVGSVLVVLSLIMAIFYYLMRRGVTYRLKGSTVD